MFINNAVFKVESVYIRTIAVNISCHKIMIERAM